MCRQPKCQKIGKFRPRNNILTNFDRFDQKITIFRSYIRFSIFSAGPRKTIKNGHFRDFRHFGTPLPLSRKRQITVLRARPPTRCPENPGSPRFGGFRGPKTCKSAVFCHLAVRGIARNGKPRISSIFEDFRGPEKISTEKSVSRVGAESPDPLKTGLGPFLMKKGHFCSNGQNDQKITIFRSYIRFRFPVHFLVDRKCQKTTKITKMAVFDGFEWPATPVFDENGGFGRFQRFGRVRGIPTQTRISPKTPIPGVW